VAAVAEQEIAAGVASGAARAIREGFVPPGELSMALQDAARDLTTQLVGEWGAGELPPGMQALGGELLTMALAARAEVGGIDAAYQQVRSLSGAVWEWLKDFIDGPRWNPAALESGGVTTRIDDPA